jgi:hypothetical protein
MFYVDIQLNLRTAVYDSNAELVTERKNIVRRYARRWLAVDLLSVLPLDGLLQSAAGLVGLLKVGGRTEGGDRWGHRCWAVSVHWLLDCWVPPTSAGLRAMSCYRAGTLYTGLSC